MLYLRNILTQIVFIFLKTKFFVSHSVELYTFMSESLNILPVKWNQFDNRCTPVVLINDIK